MDAIRTQLESLRSALAAEKHDAHPNLPQIRGLVSAACGRADCAPVETGNPAKAP